VSGIARRRLLALDLPPGEAFAGALRRAWSDGDAVLPLDPRAPVAAKRAVLAAMRPHVVIDASGDTAYDDPAPLADDVALVIATSGSTGEPKGAQLSRAALEASAAGTAERIGETPADRWLSCLPWQHIGGLQVLLRAMRSRLPLTTLAEFDVAAVATAVAAGATLTSLVPTTLRRLLAAGVDTSPMRAILLGGAAAPGSLLAEAAAVGAPVVTTYGMSETSGGCVYDGRPLPGVQVRIAADGRIEIGGATLMRGYRLRDDLDAAAFTADGWLRTGDVGSLDADGRLQVLGRADDVIVTGGEKVAATALARLVADHPAIADAAVAGVADPEWGEAVVVVAELTGAALLDLAGLRDWLADRVPGWSLPRRLVVVDRLPRLASGKTDRLAVAGLAAEPD
jgi:O-succinylbenzoic acid--CoA ligase